MRTLNKDKSRVHEESIWTELGNIEWLKMNRRKWERTFNKPIHSSDTSIEFSPQTKPLLHVVMLTKTSSSNIIVTITIIIIRMKWKSDNYSRWFYNFFSSFPSFPLLLLLSVSPYFSLVTLWADLAGFDFVDSFQHFTIYTNNKVVWFIC